jgi:hypothetical protein
MATKYNRQKRRTRKTKRSKRYRGGDALTKEEKDILTEEYTGKKSPTIIELREFVNGKINMGKFQEVIRVVVGLTGPLSSTPSSYIPPALPTFTPIKLYPSENEQFVIGDKYTLNVDLLKGNEYNDIKLSTYTGTLVQLPEVRMGPYGGQLKFTLTSFNDLKNIKQHGTCAYMDLSIDGTVKRFTIHNDASEYITSITHN